VRRGADDVRDRFHAEAIQDRAIGILRDDEQPEIEVAGRAAQAVTKGSDLSRGHDPGVRSEPGGLIHWLRSDSFYGEYAGRSKRRLRNP
jgi:hypothetical protein